MAPLALVVDDEPDLARMVEFNLRAAGFDVVIAYDGLDALARAVERVPDAVLLDLGLPGIDGYEVCRRLRADPRTSKVGIVMMTAGALSEDRIEGFEAGTDDYVVKPFNIRELVLRTRAVLRRVAPPEGAARDLVSAGPVVLDRTSREVTVDGEPVELRRLEYLILELLMTQPDRIFSRKDLLAAVWGVRYGVNERLVDVTISRLRENLGTRWHVIETRPGLGYRLRRAEPTAS
jgi:two-component system phosphate regulon response regulator PhoB